MHNLLKDLEEHMFYPKNLSKYTNLEGKVNDDTNTNKKKIKNKVKNDDIFYPRERDNLFWCFYICNFGIDEYYNVKNKFVEEKKIKYDMIEKLRGKKEIFKLFKISRNTFEDDMANNKRISLNSFRILSYFHELNIFYVNDRKYFSMILNDNTNILMLVKNDKNYGVQSNISMDKINYYKEHYWELFNLDKPLRTISYYKVDDLRTICKKINIDFNGMTKNKMYEVILSKL